MTVTGVQFPLPLRLEPRRGRGEVFRLCQDWTFRVLWDTADPDDVDVPAGFETDGYSVPRALWLVVSPWDECPEDAVAHDWCYRAMIPAGYVDRRNADLILWYGMAGVASLTRLAIYRAVRLAGWRCVAKEPWRLDEAAQLATWEPM